MMSLRDEVQDVLYDEWLTDSQYKAIIALVLDEAIEAVKDSLKGQVLNETAIKLATRAIERLKEKDDEQRTTNT